MYVYLPKVKKLLQLLYNGTFEVLKRDDTHFALQLQDRTNTVSLDRLKPAHRRLIQNHQIIQLNQLLPQYLLHPLQQ